MVYRRKWLIGEAVVNDAVTMVFILSRIARIVDQKRRKKNCDDIGTRCVFDCELHSGRPRT